MASDTTRQKPGTSTISPTSVVDKSVLALLFRILISHHANFNVRLGMRVNICFLNIVHMHKKEPDEEMYADVAALMPHVEHNEYRAKNMPTGRNPLLIKVRALIFLQCNDNVSTPFINFRANQRGLF